MSAPDEPTFPCGHPRSESNSTPVSSSKGTMRCRICKISKNTKRKQLARAHEQLAVAKADAMEKYGIAAPSFDMHDVATLRSFVAATVEAVASKRLTPAAGHCLLAAAKLGKDLLGLELDLTLLKKLEEE